MQNYKKSRTTLIMMGKDKSDEEKDAIYLYAQKIWQEYSDLLQETKYNFNLNRSQFKFLKNLLVTKMQYDVNTVFIALELEEITKQL